MRRSLFNPIGALCVLAIIVQAAEGQSASLRRAKRLFKQSDYTEAKRELQKELPGLKGNSYSEGLLLLAKLETRVEDAVPLYTEIISLGRTKDALRAETELAKIHYAAGDYPKAVRLLSNVPSGGDSGDRLEAIYFRALSWRQMGEMERARLDLESIDRGEYLYWSYMALAELDMQEGRIEDAVERYESIAGGHSNPIAGFKLAECYEILGERQKATDTYQTLVHQFPKSLEAPKAREKIQRISYIRRTGRFGRKRGGGEERDREAASSGTPGYTVQFGAFTERGNAIRMAEDLERVTEDVWVERKDIAGKIWHRVRVGRYSNKREAENKAEQLQGKTGLSGKVLPLE